MNYVVVFDAAEAGYRHWWLPLPALIFAALGVGLLLYRRAHPEETAKLLQNPTPFVFIGVGLATMLALFAITFSQYRALRDSLLAKKYQVVEGKVTEFVPRDGFGPGAETFVLSGRRYKYSGGPEPGFNTTQGQGGPVREGLQVRIADVNGQIARLEIADAEPARQAFGLQTALIWFIVISNALGAIWLVAKYRRIKSRQPKIAVADIIFEESNVSGRSLKNVMTQLWFAFGSVRVVVTRECLWITASFPHALISFAYDMEHVISRNSITSVEESSSFGREGALIGYVDEQGKRHYSLSLPKRSSGLYSRDNRIVGESLG